MTLSGNRGDGSPVAGTYTFERRVSVRWPDCLRIEEHAIDMVGMKPEDELGLRHAIDQTTVLTPAHEVFYVRSDGLDVKSGGQHTLEESLGRVVRDSPVAVALWLGGADGRAALARSTATENTLRVPLASAQEALLQINNGRAQLTSIRSTAGTGPGWQEVYGGYATLTPSLPAMPTTRTSTLVLENAKPVANTSTLVQHEFGVPLGDEVFQPPTSPRMIERATAARDAAEKQAGATALGPPVAPASPTTGPAAAPHSTPLDRSPSPAAHTSPIRWWLAAATALTLAAIVVAVWVRRRQ